MAVVLEEPVVKTIAAWEYEVEATFVYVSVPPKFFTPIARVSPAVATLPQPVSRYVVEGERPVRDWFAPLPLAAVVNASAPVRELDAVTEDAVPLACVHGDKLPVSKPALDSRLPPVPLYAPMLGAAVADTVLP